MKKANRYLILDFIRGVALIGMIVFHTLWDMMYMFEYEIKWLPDIEDIFYQYGGCIFIVLSGFCWSLGRKKLKRGIMMLAFSAVISLVTIYFMPENLILFGVICHMGTACILMIPLSKVLKRVNPYIGALISVCAFILTKKADFGYIGIGKTEFFTLPESWYANYFTAYLGFPPRGFASMDYFPVIPWIFLFIAGYFVYEIFRRRNWLKYLSPSIFKPVEWIGQNSLIIYLIHQPAIYAVLTLLDYMAVI